MTAIESMRMACEHAEGKTKRDKERLSHAMSIGITVNAKHAGLLPDYQKESFWDDVRKQKG